MGHVGGLNYGALGVLCEVEGIPSQGRGRLATATTVQKTAQELETKCAATIIPHIYVLTPFGPLYQFNL